MEIVIMPSYLELSRLIIRDAILSDCDKLQEIANAGSYIDKWAGTTTAPNSIYKSITEGDLPPVPEAGREYYSFKAICLKDSGTAI